MKNNIRISQITPRGYFSIKFSSKKVSVFGILLIASPRGGGEELQIFLSTSIANFPKIFFVTFVKKFLATLDSYSHIFYVFLF
jgi:hypothetical protein